MSGNGPVVLDPRLLSVSIQVNNTIKTYDQSFWIRAKGSKFANSLQNECTVEISNLDTATRNYLLTETSPFNKNKTPKVLSLFAGRVSTGMSLVYQGDIQTSGITQPPDITLTLKCGTAHFMKGKVGSRSGGKSSTLASISGGVASTLGLSLNNQANPRTIANYNHNGNALEEVDNIQSMGVDAYVDDNQLVVKEVGVPLSGTVIQLSEQSGMIGIPEITEQGLKVTFLYNSSAKLGSGVQVTSLLNPSANGMFVIYKLNFALASREKEFYYMAECVKAKS